MEPEILKKGHVIFHPIWKKPILNVTKQGQKCDMNTEDGTRAHLCPVYRSAVTSVLYLVTTDPFSITWRGGKEVELECPDWWKESMDAGRAEWAINASKMGMTENPTEFRFRHTRPLACPEAGVSPLGGHLMVNFFTGLSIETNPGVKTLVMPPVNHNHSPNWTTQVGIYDSDEFRGDFSFNLILLRQDVKVSFSAFQPVCSLLSFGDMGTAGYMGSHGVALGGRVDQANRHYFAKTQMACPYGRAVTFSNGLQK